MPNDPAIDFYRGEAGTRYHQNKRGIPKAALPWVARKRAEKITPHVTPGDTVLEFGVGTGWNLAALKCARRLGHDVANFLAPDLSTQEVEFVEDTTTLQANTVDVVLCHHTLEHLARPWGALVEMKRLLRTGGTLLVFVPYEKERRYRTHRADEPNHHLHSWNAQTLGNLVAVAGFELQSVKLARFRYDRFASHWAARLRLGETGYRFIRALGNGINPEFEIQLAATAPD